MARDDIPDITPEEKSEIQKMLDEIPWAVGTDPLDPEEPDIDLEEWTERVAAVLRRNGYNAVSHAEKDGKREHEGTITFDYHSVIVRHRDELADGIGCCLYDAKRHQFKPILLAVLPDATYTGDVRIARRTIDGNVPPIQLWVLNVAAATLDMGDGRTIDVP